MSRLRGVRICECLSEETQIIDLFTNCKLRPHKLSQCTLATRLNSCQLWILFRPVARFFLWESAIQEGDGPNEAKGVSLQGESFGCLRLNCAANLQLGGEGLTSNALTCASQGYPGLCSRPPPPHPTHTPYGLGNVLKMAIDIVVLLFICLIHYFSNFVIARFSAPDSSIWFP